MSRLLTTVFSFLLLGDLSGQAVNNQLQISHLTDDFYVYTTYSIYKGDHIGANGMYLVTNKGAVLFDTPWDTTQFQPLLDSIRLKHHLKVVLCIATHFHEDRTGGLAYYRGQGIRTFTTKRTDDLSRARGMNRAQFLMAEDTVFKIGQYSFRAYYPGPGHAPDNIVIWFARERILYGGCLIKSINDTSLGNLSDANTKKYATSLKNVQHECRNPRYIITGHNDYKSTRSLEHTLKMAEKLNG
jgi:metallo-beta-lactamase class B